MHTHSAHSDTIELMIFNIGIIVVCLRDLTRTCKNVMAAVIGDANQSSMKSGGAKRQHVVHSTMLLLVSPPKCALEYSTGSSSNCSISSSVRHMQGNTNWPMTVSRWGLRSCHIVFGLTLWIDERQGGISLRRIGTHQSSRNSSMKRLHRLLIHTDPLT